jgi:hypothetical protein
MYTVPMGRFGRMKMSHMIGDNEDELHAMAAKIGVARRWYQGDHYDVAMVARAKAVFHGAVEIGMRNLSAMVMNRRQGLPMGNPETAMEDRMKHRAERRAVPS